MKTSLIFYDKLISSKKNKRKKERNSVIANTNAVNVFSFLINNAINDENRKHFFQQTYIERKTPLEILRDELVKEVGDSKLIQKSPDVLRRDANKIRLALYEITNMKKFLNFQGISDSSLTKVAYYMQYKKYTKGEYIFHQGDKAHNFYGILDGTISLVYNYIDSYDLDSENNPIKKQVEKLKLTTGWCFDEWALIFDKPHTTDALCLTTVEVFYIPESTFMTYLAKEIYKTDNEKKNFICKKLPGIQKHSIENILTSIVPIFYSKNDFLYKDGEQALNVFVIFQGECTCKKYLGNNPKNKHKISMMDDLFKVDQGCMIGLEIISKEKVYKCNIIARKDFTIAYKISNQILKKFHYNYENLIPLYEKQKQLIDESINRAMIRRKKLINKNSKGEIINLDYFVEESFNEILNKYNTLNKDVKKVYKRNDILNCTKIRENGKILHKKSLSEFGRIYKKDSLFNKKNNINNKIKNDSFINMNIENNRNCGSKRNLKLSSTTNRNKSNIDIMNVKNNIHINLKSSLSETYLRGNVNINNFEKNKHKYCASNNSLKYRNITYNNNERMKTTLIQTLGFSSEIAMRLMNEFNTFNIPYKTKTIENIDLSKKAMNKKLIEGKVCISNKKIKGKISNKFINKYSDSKDNINSEKNFKYNIFGETLYKLKKGDKNLKYNKFKERNNGRRMLTLNSGVFSLPIISNINEYKIV